MKSKTMKEVALLTEKHWGREKAEKITADAEIRWQELCFENQKVCKEKKRHLFENIFPCIGYYEALCKNGVSPEEAFRFLDECWSMRARKGANFTKKLLGICGLYRCYPAMFRFVAKHQFGSKAGFASTVYKKEKGRCKFDMTKCLFLETCQKYKCPRLTSVFCHTDDVNNANLHPKLCWNRTQFMGNGGAFCDFDIYVKREKGRRL